MTIFLGIVLAVVLITWVVTFWDLSVAVRDMAGSIVRRIALSVGMICGLVWIYFPALRWWGVALALLCAAGSWVLRYAEQ